MDSNSKNIFSFIMGFVVIGILMIFVPSIKIALAERDGRAKLNSAKLLAQAEIERAKGVAESNKIISDSLKNNENYLKYLQIQALENTQNQVIYIPTEASLPILESGKRK